MKFKKKNTKKGATSLALTLIVMAIIAVVILFVVIPAIQGQGGLWGIIKGLLGFGDKGLDDLESYRQTPDFVKEQQEAQTFDEYIQRIASTQSCERYKEAQILYSNAKFTNKEGIITWNVCVQNEEGNLGTTDKTQYCKTVDDGKKQQEEVKYFLEYVKCKLAEGRTQDTCDFVKKFLDSAGIQTFIANEKNAKYAPHKAYYMLGQCYQTLPQNPETLKLASEAYQDFIDQEEKFSTAPELVDNARKQAETTATTSEDWAKVVKEFSGNDPRTLLNNAYGKYTNPNSARKQAEIQESIQEFTNLIETISELEGKYESNSNTILKNLIANAFYFRGKASAELETIPIIKCDILARESGIDELVYKAPSSYISTHGLNNELFRLGEHKGKPVISHALNEIGQCYQGASQSGDDYFKELLLNFDETDPSVQSALTALNPSCNTIEDNAALFNDKSECITANSNFKGAVKANSETSHKLFCYWSTDTTPWYTDGECLPCTDPAAPKDQC